MSFLGVDVGGTKTKFVLWNRRVLRRGSLNWKFGGRFEDLRDEVFGLTKEFEVKGIGYSIKGVWTKEEKRKMENILKGRVLSDAEGVLYDAFGEKDGMVLIAGTGSICLAKLNGELYRFGGYGYMFSDWGSAFWIGKVAVEVALKKESFLRLAIFKTKDLDTIRVKVKKLMSLGKEDMVRKVASFSKLVIRCAELGDEDGIFITRLAIKELLSMCLKLRSVCPVDDLALHGGLFKNKTFRNSFLESVKRYNLRVVGYNFDASRGVAKFITASGGLR